MYPLAVFTLQCVRYWRKPDLVVTYVCVYLRFIASFAETKGAAEFLLITDGRVGHRVVRAKRDRRGIGEKLYWTRAVVVGL